MQYAGKSTSKKIIIKSYGRRMMKTMIKNILKTGAKCLSVLLLIYFFASIVDVNLHNTPGHGSISEYNLFVVLSRLYK